ncbi:MAG: helicase C-terminal domain-containing protein [Planctomycetota bacterium]
MSYEAGTSAQECFTTAARNYLASEIHSAGGNEVFFYGTRGEDGRVDDVIAVARGNKGAVPVFLERAGDHEVLIHNHPGGDLTPSPADLSIASEAGVRGLGFFIIDNEAERVYRAVEPFERRDEVPVDEDEVAAIFSAGGLLAQALPAFESRDGQRQLALQVARSFNRGEVAALEAGTGVGKSFAYLVPAILWAVHNRSRVVISTHTIALQEQLVQRDLPLLERVLADTPFEYTLIKGRSNYACKRKAAQVGGQQELFDSDDERTNWNEEILERLAAGGEGSLSELPRTPPDHVWSDFASTTDQSLKVRCPHYRSCFYYNARRNAAKAQIVVVNHHLFFADLSVRSDTNSFDSDFVLPGYRRVVFDEAHRLEDVAAQHFGVRFSRIGMLQAIGRFLTRDHRNRERGRVMYMLSVLRRQSSPAAEHLEFELKPRLEDLRRRVEEAFAELQGRILNEQRSRDDDVARQTIPGQPMFRIGYHPGDLPRAVLEGPLNELIDDLGFLKREIRHGRDLLSDYPFEPEDEYEGMHGEYRSLHTRVDEQISAIDRFLGGGDSVLPWVEVTTGGRSNLTCQVAPIRVAELLEAKLYRPLHSVIMTSATLTVDDGWEFLSDRLGWELIEQGRFVGSKFPSPFDYQEQVALALPDDLPPPNTRKFEERLAALVVASARIVGGRMFVLFTAHQTLRQVARRTEDELRGLGYPVLIQGQAPRTELLRRFREAGNAVLFGNQSFWEGVDVPGGALECVVIARLPFRVPTHPLEKARAEEVAARGLNPFRQLAVPQAALALKQGFGRLIRTRTDRGVVVIADPRIHNRSYGGLFLRSLPECNTLIGPWSEILPELQSSFDGDRSDLHWRTDGWT